jgi:hypothetical protein
VIPTIKLLAFFLSLPLVLLSWSLITFAFAIAMYAFNNQRPWWSYTWVGVALFVIVFIVASTILFFWGIFSARQGSIRIRNLWKRLFHPVPPKVVDKNHA